MSMIEQARNPCDPMDGQPIRCEIEMDAAGQVTLMRSAGCTETDARELCVLVGAGDTRVRDRTPA